MDRNLSDEHKQLAAKIVVEALDAYAVLLFGSAASGTLHDDSDVDLTFLSDRRHAPYDIFLVAQRIADALGREVDLVDFSQASTVFQAQIVGSAVILIDDRPLDRQYAFMRALKAYAMLNEERRPILEKLGYIGGSQPDDGQYSRQ